MHRWTRSGPLEAAVILACAISVAAPLRPLAAQALVDPCADLPEHVVEEVMAAHGTRATVAEAIPVAAGAFGTCTYQFDGGALTLELLARAAGSAAELEALFERTPRPPDARTVAGIGDEAFRYPSARGSGMMFRAGRVMATIDIEGAAAGLDAAVVELGRRWAARLGGAPAPTAVVAAADAADAADASEPTSPPVALVEAAPTGVREPADPDTLPTCATDVQGICVPDEPTLLALALAEALAEDEEPEVVRSAIREVVLSAGFPILEADGSTTPPLTAQGQGIAVHAWELEGVARLVERGATFPLDTVAASLAALWGLEDAGPIAGLLMEGIRAQAASDREPSRSWARLIATLGQQRQGIDILGPVATGRIDIDALQMLLVLRRLAGDLAAASGAPSSSLRWEQEPARVLGGGAGGLVGSRRFGMRRFGETDPAWRPSIHPTAFAPATIRPAIPVAARGATVLAGCAPDETTSYITDWAAIGLTTAFGGIGSYPGLIGYLEAGLSGKASQAAGKYGKYLGAANHVLSLVKLMMTYASIEAELEMEGSGPLERTRSQSTPGEQRTVHATLTMDVDDAQWFNCARLALNQFGLDFSVPNGGALSGVETWWRLEEGGVERIGSAQYDMGIVQFGQGQFTERRFTDAGGRSSVLMEGKPQRYELSQQAREVMKQATVRLEVKIKPANLLKELPDIAGVALAGPGAPWAAAMEMYYRSLVPVKALTFPVRDWTDRLRFRVTSIGEQGAGGYCYNASGFTGEGKYTERYDVTVDHDGAVVVTQRNVQTCSAIESTAEDADHAQCRLTGNFAGRMMLDGLYWEKTADYYVRDGRPTREALMVNFEPYLDARASVSSNCEALDEKNWLQELTKNFVAYFPPIPEGATSVRSLDGSYLLEVLEGDLHMFRVR